VDVFAGVVGALLVALVLVAGRQLGEWRERRRRESALAPRVSEKSLEELAESDPWAVVYARRVVVNLKTGRAIDGLLVRKDGPLLFLKNAVLLEEGSEPAAIDGEAVVHAAEIDFIQAL